MGEHREIFAAMLPLLIAIMLLWALLGWMRFQRRSGDDREDEPEALDSGKRENGATEDGWFHLAGVIGVSQRRSGQILTWIRDR